MKTEGQDVKVGDLLAEIETDKSVMELESLYEGILFKNLVKEGETIPVGADICILKNSEIIFDKKISNTTNEKIGKTSICAHDNYFKKSKDSSGSIDTKLKFRGNLINLNKINAFGKYSTTRYESTSLEKFIANKVSLSKKNVPHFYVESEINLYSLLCFRKKINKFLKLNSLSSLSINDFFLKITATALNEFKIINSSWKDGNIETYNFINLGFLVNTKVGLFIPVIENCDKKNILDISKEAKQLIIRLRSCEKNIQKNKPCTFTITNLGMYGVQNFLGIINEPNVGILSVSSISERLKLVNNVLINYPFVRISLSCDHRVLNGVEASEFLNKIKFLAENPHILPLY
ncbi:hypothetical protein E5P55_00660 [Candidatus Pinguicoccus supinus]|uniref:Dihydrolipoamide acetyltransferase component of pyruvate dehydrogenase complex n=1 Tax=Candidatus Pinguicoccus supinus TaxID=2529394 RepID=A0A7T0BSH8_9BACT|nr:hypothetical protein E5P55_00660 [Candidatus Pinguicoccus supinus]